MCLMDIGQYHMDQTEYFAYSDGPSAASPTKHFVLQATDTSWLNDGEERTQISTDADSGQFDESAAEQRYFVGLRVEQTGIRRRVKEDTTDFLSHVSNSPLIRSTDSLPLAQMLPPGRPTDSLPRAPMLLICHPTQRPISVRLDNRDLWMRFCSVGTEMVVTKTGRRMFPSLKISLDGLHDDVLYTLQVDMAALDGYRYKYNSSRWALAGKAETRAAPPRPYVHPDSPAPGRHWMSESVSFHKLKLTNNAAMAETHTLLNSMQRYQPHLSIIPTADVTLMTSLQDASQFDESCSDVTLMTSQQDATQHDTSPHGHVTVAFPETSFMAVTAYQNERVTQLKIEHNPFARGVRKVT